MAYVDGLESKPYAPPFPGMYCVVKLLAVFVVPAWKSPFNTIFDPIFPVSTLYQPESATVI